MESLSNRAATPTPSASGSTTSSVRSAMTGYFRRSRSRRSESDGETKSDLSVPDDQKAASRLSPMTALKFEKLRISPDVFHFGHGKKDRKESPTNKPSCTSDNLRDCLSDSEAARNDVFDRLVNGSVGQVHRKKRKLRPIRLLISVKA